MKYIFGSFSREPVVVKQPSLLGSMSRHCYAIIMCGLMIRPWTVSPLPGPSATSSINSEFWQQAQGPAVVSEILIPCLTNVLRGWDKKNVRASDVGPQRRNHVTR
jgi:hypothetical protein